VTILGRLDDKGHTDGDGEKNDKAIVTFPRFSEDCVKQSPLYVHTPLDSCCQEKNESAHDCIIHGSTQRCSGLPPP
jgi:hypothetical protein